MANNCLVKSLKVFVNNDNLNKIGELSYNYNVTDISQIVGFRIIGSNMVASKAVIKNGETIPAGTAFTQVAAYPLYPTSTGEIKITALNKYNIDEITSIGGPMSNDFSLDEISYCLDLLKLYLPDSDVPCGNIECLKNLTRLRTLRLNSKNIYGNIDALHLSNLTGVLEIRGINITGSGINLASSVGLTDVRLYIPNVCTGAQFAAAQVSAGRTSGSCKFRYDGGGIDTIYYGSSMSGQNPTAEETAQGWCIR